MDHRNLESLAPRRSTGFTLVEMLVVIVIMSILMTAGAIGLSGMGGKGITSGVATVESLFDEARAVAVGQRTISRVLIAKDLSGKPEDNLRKVTIANRPLKADGTLDMTKWVLSSRGTTLPDQVYFSQTFSRLDSQAGTGVIPEMTLTTTGAASAGTYFYYEFNSEGICAPPMAGASFVLGLGRRSVNALPTEQPRVSAAAKNDFGGFVVWRNGRTSTFRSPSQIFTSNNSPKTGDTF